MPLKRWSVPDNYGAESFLANGGVLAVVAGQSAVLRFDGQGYDAVPKQFAVEIQSPVDVKGQKIVTAALNGVVGTGQLTGATQVGTGLVVNASESPTGSL